MSMKALMYHYVRPGSQGYPHFRYLARSDFRDQLAYLKEEFGLISKDDFFTSLESGKPARGVLLTFDDGVKDHREHVFPELLEAGAWGMFFVPTGPLETGEVLDVHRIHHLLGKHGGEAVLQALNPMLEEGMLADRAREEFSRATYQRQSNDEATTRVKRMLNYWVDYRHRKELLDQLEAVFPGTVPGVGDLYLTPEEIREMADGGMIMGNHSVTHRVFSKLNSQEQRTEIENSFQTLDGILPAEHPRCFCYPYGGRHTFGPETEALLEENKNRFAFCVDPREITEEDLRQHLQALPRFDCNQFPHGQASCG